MKLTKHLVEKPWGRADIPAAFGDTGGQRIGEIWYDDGADHPLPILVKWLFTSEKLSIQVHPDDAQARARGLSSGKQECWVIVDAEPGAVLGMGTTHPLSAEELRATSLSGEIEALIDWKPVKAGDYFYIPAGTVHAIGAGITLVEVQQYADVTYRLYDYGRLDKGLPRELHLEDGVAVSDARPYDDHRSGRVDDSVTLVTDSEFWLRYCVGETAIRQISTDGPFWIVPIDGDVASGTEIARRGDCLLLETLDRLSCSSDCKALVAGVNLAPDFKGVSPK